MARSHTRRGPGRTHGQCALIVDPTNGKVLGVNTPKQRHAPAAHGGNWQGVPYLSMREHDLLTQLTRLGPTPASRTLGAIYPMTRDQAVELVVALRSGR